MINSFAKSLYIHIPYCKRICSYCDFCKKNYDFSECLLFILDLIKSLKNNNKKYKTIYIGGGTPTCLDNKLLELLLKSVSSHLDENYEFTIEANPENLTKEKLKLLKKYSVNRLSIGVQTFDEKILKILNREVTDVPSIVQNAHKYVKNINLDLIYGMEFSSFETLKNDLEIAIKLPINHISLYSLIINPHTILFNQGIKEMDDDLLREQYDFIRTFLIKNGFVHYEVSNFAKPGFESKHNIVYWKNEPYDAYGPGASGYNNIYRYKYTNNVLDYINNKTLVEKIKIDENDAFEYEILLGLRLSEGLDLEKINHKYGINFVEKYKKQINNLVKLNLIEVNEKSLKCRYEGTFVQEEIFRKLIF